MSGLQRPGAAARFAILCGVAVGFVVAIVTAIQISAALAAVAAATAVGFAPSAEAVRLAMAVGPLTSCVGIAFQWTPERSAVTGAGTASAAAVLAALLL